SERAHWLAASVGSGLWFAGLVVVTRLLVRHAVAGAVLGVVVVALSESDLYFFLAGDSTWGAVAHSVGLGVGVVWLYSRVGALAVVVFTYVMRSIGLFTLEFDDWSTPYLLVLVASVVLLAAYAFWVTLAGQPMLERGYAEPQAAP
ncbi:MAG: hypothetical protein ACYTGP_10410, partial [Planctomycetota bacterium]